MLRLYLAPIKPGWWWRDQSWVFDQLTPDARSDEERTKEEVLKSLNGVLDFLGFTAENESDFEQKYLPTLDFQTRVTNNGKILFKHFDKPMLNNIVLENGTALSKNTIFSSLRQDLIRGLLNTSTEEPFCIRMEVIENPNQ